MSCRRSTELNEAYLPDFRENILDPLEEALLCGIVMMRYPLSLQDPPYGFRYVEIRGAGRKVEYEEPPFIPSLKACLHLAAFIYVGIVDQQHRGLGHAHVEAAHKLDEPAGIYRFCGCETVAAAVAVNHPEDVEPALLQGGDDTCLAREEAAIRHITLGTDMAPVSGIKVCETGLPQFFKLLPQLLTVPVVLRRGGSLWIFPYTSRSYANADKKIPGVPLDSFLPVGFSTSAHAIFTPCRCFLMASLTACPSFFSGTRFRPCPDSVFRPSSHFSGNRLTRCISPWCVFPARARAAALLMPSALGRTMWHLIRKQWVFPSRYPFVRDALWASDISIFVACLDIVSILCKTNQTNSVPHYVN